MSTVIDARAFAPGDREEAIRDAVWQSLVRVDITHRPDPAEIAAVCVLDAVGPLTTCTVRANATTVRRPGRLARADEPPAFFLGVQGRGASLVVQDGREAALAPGDMALYDTTRPYTLVNDGGIDHHYVRIPRAALPLPARALRELTAVRLPAADPLVRVLARHLEALAAESRRLGPAEAALLTVPTLTMVGAAVAARLGHAEAAREPLRDSLVARVTAYVEQHLGDPDLTPDRIAAAHHVSRRQLYAVLAAAGLRPGELIRHTRLERARADLAAPGTGTVAAVARRRGFTDARHFSRLFREAYGMSPREWRELSRHPR